MEKAWMELDLMLFGEGGAGAAGAAEGAAGEGAGEAAAEPQAAPVHERKRGKANPLENVVYGKQANAQEEAPDEPTEPEPSAGTKEQSDAERRAAFDAFLADPQNKALYDERVNGLINRRFKAHGEMEAKLAAAQPVLDTLMAKHGVKSMEELQAAIDADASYFEDAANEAGMTVEQYKRFQAVERENARLREAEEHRAQREGVERAAQEWMQQAEALKQKFPDFDLQREINDPVTGERFVSLLRSGNIGVDVAYQVIHMDELMSGAIGQAVRTAQEKVINNIRARGLRPSENGNGGGAAGVIVKKDPSKFTKADRNEISRRVMRGEEINL